MRASSPGLRALAAGVALLAASAFIGCTPKPWNAARRVVLSAADGVAAADTAVRDAYVDSGCLESEDVDVVRECVAEHRRRVEALRLARDSVAEAETAVDAWEQAKTAPTDWLGWLTTVSQALARGAAICESAGVPVPEDISSTASTVDGLLEQARR